MHRQILKLTIPNIISNLTVPLLTIVDLHLMGYLDSAQFMGAVALGGVIFNIVYWNFGTLRSSVSGLAAQAYGEGDLKQQAMVFYRGLAIALAGGLLVLCLQYPIGIASFWLLDGSEAVKSLAANYFFIRIWAAPAAIAMMVLNGWFLGMQNARYPMITSLVINGVNIIASVVLVRVGHLEERGVALGSVIAQYIGLGLSVILFLRKYRAMILYFSVRAVLERHHLARFMRVSGDIYIRTLCLISVFTYFTSASAGYGDLILAANTALLQYLLLFSYFLDGFAYAAEALVGRFFGSKDKKKLREAVNKLFLWGFFFAAIFTAIYGIGGRQFLYLFTDQKEVLDAAQPFILWATLFPLASFASYLWDGIYIGATASAAMRNTMLFASVCCFFIPYFLLAPYWGNHALWISMIGYMAGRSLSQTILAPRAVFHSSLLSGFIKEKD